MPPEQRVFYFVYGVRRSGNHAIISWLYDLLSDPALHLNNVLSPGEDPFRSWQQMYVRGLGYWQCNPHPVQAFKIWVSRKEQPYRFTRKKHTRLAVDALRAAPGKSVVLSFEDQELDATLAAEARVRAEEALGPASRTHQLVVLRDPANMLSSLLQRGMVDRASIPRVLDLYLRHARLAVSKESGFVPVVFERWMHDAEYRRELGARLGLETDGAPYEKVPREGGGSSFAGHVPRASELRPTVNQRWRHFLDAPWFVESLLGNDELLRLAGALHGEHFEELIGEIRCAAGRGAGAQGSGARHRT